MNPENNIDEVSSNVESDLAIIRSLSYEIKALAYEVRDYFYGNKYKFPDTVEGTSSSDTDSYYARLLCSIDEIRDNLYEIKRALEHTK